MKMIFHYATKYTNEDIYHSFQYAKSILLCNQTYRIGIVQSFEI